MRSPKRQGHVLKFRCRIILSNLYWLFGQYFCHEISIYLLCRFGILKWAKMDLIFLTEDKNFILVYLPNIYTMIIRIHHAKLILLWSFKPIDFWSVRIQLKKPFVRRNQLGSSIPQWKNSKTTSGKISFTKTQFEGFYRIF